MTPETIFMTVLLSMTPTCQPSFPHIIQSSDYLDSVHKQGNARGAYILASNTIVLRDSWDGSWKDRRTLAHEMCHTVQHGCGLSYSEAQCYQIEKEF